MNHDDEYHGDINYGNRFEEDWYWVDKPNTKGRKKPQQVRQAKARTKALIKKLNHTHTTQGRD